MYLVKLTVTIEQLTQETIAVITSFLVKQKYNLSNNCARFLCVVGCKIYGDSISL